MQLSVHKTRSVFERYNIVSEGDLRAAAEKLDQAAMTAKATPLRRVQTQGRGRGMRRGGWLCSDGSRLGTVSGTVSPRRDL